MADFIKNEIAASSNQSPPIVILSGAKDLGKGKPRFFNRYAQSE